MKSNKIGIVTPFRVANYGTKLQAYAMITYLQSCTDSVVEIINYLPSSDRRLKTIIRKVFSLKLNIARIKKRSNNRKIVRIVGKEVLTKRKEAINAFDSKFTVGKRITDYSELINASKNYKCIVCGSDQIWVPDNLNDGYYTLEFVDKQTKKGAYAASLGIETVTLKQKEMYVRFLHNLDFISVRENCGRDLLSSFFKEKKIEWVCDPTFLIHSNEWRELSIRPSVLDSLQNDFVFCYFLSTEERFRKNVFEYARKNNLTILSLSNFKGYCASDNELVDFSLYDLTVNEFLYLIDHANFIFTDSMHASIFSIIFEKNFVTFERFNKNDNNSRNSRIYSLFEATGLEDRLVSDEPIPTHDIDYSIVNDKKNIYINNSIDFIRREIIPCL